MLFAHCNTLCSNGNHWEMATTNMSSASVRKNITIQAARNRPDKQHPSYSSSPPFSSSPPTRAAHRNCSVYIFVAAIPPSSSCTRVATLCTALNAGATFAEATRPRAPGCREGPCCVSTCCIQWSMYWTWGVVSSWFASHVSNCVCWGEGGCV